MKINFEKGITIISLVITIVLMLILTSVVVTGAIKGNLFKKAGETNLREEIATIKIALDKKLMLNEGKVSDGTINEILGMDTKYEDSLKIEDGELVYIEEMWNLQDEEALKEMGINKSKN